MSMYSRLKTRKGSSVASLSNELHNECKNLRPLKENLRTKLESLPRSVRAVVVAVKKDGCTPLFVSAKIGNVEVVEYLITVCDANIEEKGIYEVHQDRTVHHVSPLWCAAINNKLPVVKCLIRLGANKNACSDTGSTPVRSACFMTHIDVVKFLVENGADIRKTNQNRGTCLINSVQSVELCAYLISKGVDVNARDIQDKTAIHYATQEERVDTVKLLLDNGADPSVRSRHGDDVLRTACLKGAIGVFDLLKSRIAYSAEQLADAHELMGATFLDERNETTLAIMHWRMAAHLRLLDSGIIVKFPEVPLRPAYLNQREFTTLEELENISFDIDAMRVQCLLIYERILGTHHKDFLHALFFRGANYINSLQFQRCIDLWMVALQIRVERDSILDSDTGHVAKALVRLMLDLYEQQFEVNPIEHADGLPLYDDALRVLLMLTQDIEQARDLLRVHPINKKQQENFDRTLKCITHLMYLCLSTGKGRHEVLMEVTRKLVVGGIRSSVSKDTLLHLSVSRLNEIKSTCVNEDPNSTFPNYLVVELLLMCGADVNAINESRSTPLLIASTFYNFQSPIIKLLLDYGAHLDQRNKNNQLPLKLILKHPKNEINYLNYLSLKCLAATVVAQYRIPYKNIIPKTLEEFVRCHE